MSRSYFISDVHLGAAFCDRKALEQRFVTLLDRIREERADAVYLLGDIFDFWYEYRYVIPRGHTRALGQWSQGVFFQRQPRCLGV